MALLAILTSRVVIEFPRGKLFNLDCFRYMFSHPILIGIGFFYNGAIWVDKVIFWISHGTPVHKGLYTSAFYETPSFLAFVTIVPTFSIFLVRVETSFYRAYRTYHSKVVAKYPLKEVLREKANMESSLKLSFYRLLIYQGTISAITIIFSPNIIQYLNM